jgi:hypothetical protein
MSDLQNKSKVAVKPEIELSEEKKHFLIKQYESCPASSGKTHYMRYLRGERLTHRQVGLAMCFECCGGYKDGRFDCHIPSCSQYPYRPYKGKSLPCHEK